MEDMLAAAVAEPPGSRQMRSVHALEAFGVGVEELADDVLPGRAGGFGVEQALLGDGAYLSTDRRSISFTRLCHPEPEALRRSSRS